MGGIRMREIKFRAWDNEAQDFIYSDDREYCCVISPDGKVLFHWVDDEEMHELNHEEGQQYTGLKDKNGKEIYESDLVTIPDHWPKYIVLFIKGKYLLNGYKELCDWHEEAEIIGNIYENPDLLDPCKP